MFTSATHAEGVTELDVNRSSIPGARGAKDDPGRRLRRVAGLHNLRDLGGYPVAGGGHTRWGVLFRGGVLGGLSPDTEAEMTALGLRTVVVRSNVVRPESHLFYEGIGYQRTATSHVYHKQV